MCLFGASAIHSNIYLSTNVQEKTSQSSLFSIPWSNISYLFYFMKIKTLLFQFFLTHGNQSDAAKKINTPKATIYLVWQWTISTCPPCNIKNNCSFFHVIWQNFFLYDTNYLSKIAIKIQYFDSNYQLQFAIFLVSIYTFLKIYHFKRILQDSPPRNKSLTSSQLNFCTRTTNTFHSFGPYLTPLQNDKTCRIYDKNNKTNWSIFIFALYQSFRAHQQDNICVLS